MDLRQLVTDASPYLDWVREHWFTLVLSGEIIGSAIAIKTGHYRKGLCWMGAALITIWAGVG